ncbi:MAG: sugar phosphate isomerase/epimerase family protein [Lacipirellulaceae bacterium]
MPRLSMNQTTTYRWSFDEDLHHYSRAGYEGVGVWLRKAHDFGEERAVELVEEAGLAVSNVVWAGGFTGSDGASVAEALADTRRALRFAGALRAACLAVYSGGRNSHTQRHAARLLRTSLDALLPLAERVRVPLALEPMHAACAHEWTFLTSFAEALDLVREYDTPWLRLVYDTYHFPLATRHSGLLAEATPYIASVHLGDGHVGGAADNDRCALGEGTVPLAGLVRTLLDAGYDGWFDVELRGSAIGPAEYEHVVRDSILVAESLFAPALAPAARCV